MLPVTLQNNKKHYLAYNAWRKKYFINNTPKDGSIILHLLPWLLSVNHPGVPGYVQDLTNAFHVFQIENNNDIMRMENEFKGRFNIKDERLSVRYPSHGELIEGIYTIGSIGTISQTSRSDCDIWICIDRSRYADNALENLNRKINLIKGWLDGQIRIPVYFFLTDVEDVRLCKFGHIDFESSGSAQKKVLKEEFYRTSIVVCGKIPFWWVCYDPIERVNYADAFQENQRSDFGQPDFIDLGDLESVDRTEFYGAALWQLNKSLTHPLKSIIKMLLLKMFLETPDEELVSHKFRRKVYESNLTKTPVDPSLFTMQEVLQYYSGRMRPDYFEFIKKCFYLRYEMKLLTGAQTLKEEVAADVFKQFRLERDDIYNLNEFEVWPLWEHIHFGGLMFEFVTDIYRDIAAIQKGIPGIIDPEDLTIIGRKLASSMDAKNFKLPPLHISSENTKLPVLTFSHSSGLWQVRSSDIREEPIIGNEDIIFCLAYLIWNGIFDPAQIRMQPNQTSVTIQEILNLGRTIRDTFGVYDIARVHFSRFLEEEKIDKILIAISFEEADFTMDVRDIRVIYKNNWEEIFVRRFPTLERLKMFLQKNATVSSRMETHYYIQRNNKYYEKIIERTKNMIAQMFMKR